MRDVVLLAHPTFGMFGALAALWAFVEALNASDANRSRISAAAWTAATCIVLACGLGAYWDTAYAAADKAIALRGPWSWAQTVLMAAKERAFVVPLLLALYLPMATAADLVRDRRARLTTMAVAAGVALGGLALEGAGAIVAYAVKLALLQP